MNFDQLLKFGVDQGASGIHLQAESTPQLRIGGLIRNVEGAPVKADELRAFIASIAPKQLADDIDQLLTVGSVFSASHPAGRFRCTTFSQIGGPALVLRVIPAKIGSVEELNLPRAVRDIALAPRGLILVAGPGGSGKSTTLAAMVDHLNDNSYGHVLTIEDPIEFVHESKKCLINQREVGPQTLSFSNALRSALREDPDCILVGELRDLETIRLALTAAETGHLVFGTLHTSSAAKTIDRVVDVFPAAEKDMVRAMLSESLIGVISQTLCKLKDGTGRAAAYEIMLGTAAIRNLIRENKIAQMYSSIQTGNSMGMQTLDQCLADLVRRNVVSPAEARQKAKFPENFPG